MHKRTVGVDCELPQRLSYKDGFQFKSVIIRTNNHRPIWTLFKEFINSLNDGDDFTRKDLIEAIYEPESAIIMRQRETTVDHYRLYGVHVGFINHVGRGKYRKVRSFPVNLSSSDLEKYAYNPTWRDWFIPKRERLKLIEKKYQ